MNPALRNLLFVAAFGALAFVALKVIASRQQRGGTADQGVMSKSLLTPNELEFLTRLELAVPELRFLAQVAMGALLKPRAAKSDRKAYYSTRGTFAQKIVDFVAMSRADGSIVAVIELDDRTHNSDKDLKRDTMLTSAGYRVIRWNSKAKPDQAAIRSTLIPKEQIGT